MKIWLGTAALLAAIFVIFVLAGRNRPSSEPADVSQSKSRSPVVVELFTSEGCSSCPPADEVLARLDKNQPVQNAEIITLSEHVDYWNQLGWSDPFSSPQFSARQNEYAQVLRGDGVYTPQIIVDGQVQFVGGNLRQAIDVIGKVARTPKVPVHLDAVAAADGTTRLRVDIDQLPRLNQGETADVVLAITESNLQSDVSRGENAGRKLSHTAVVRQLWSLGNVASHTDRFTAEPTLVQDKSWQPKELRVVVFLQERASRHILGAAAISLNSSRKNV